MHHHSSASQSVKLIRHDSLPDPATRLQVLGCAKMLRMWGREGDAPATFYDLIARDKEIVKVVLLLTGSIEGAKQGVLDYTLTFDKFAFLWRNDLAVEYAAFIATNPNLEVRWVAAVQYELLDCWT